MRYCEESLKAKVENSMHSLSEEGLKYAKSIVADLEEFIEHEKA